MVINRVWVAVVRAHAMSRKKVLTVTVVWGPPYLAQLICLCLPPFCGNMFEFRAQRLCFLIFTYSLNWFKSLLDYEKTKINIIEDGIFKQFQSSILAQKMLQILGIQMIQIILIVKQNWVIPVFFFLHFRHFSTVCNTDYRYVVNKITDDWILKGDLCHRKWPLYQLRHNHCPLFLIVTLKNA